jgi:hypothetical protein
MSRAEQAGTFCARTHTWRGREALRLTNGVLNSTVLRRGCSIAELRLIESEDAVSGNLVWESPWLGADHPMGDDELARRYGDANSGRFLHHYTGHALCLDGFGPASAREFACGSGLHGEAIGRDWQVAAKGSGEVRLRTLLPGAALVVERAFEMLPGEGVLRVRESVSNLASASRNLHWVQHATVGPAAFPAGARVTTNAREGLTWPLDYEGSNALRRDASFEWPCAPGADGCPVDVSELFCAPHSGFVAALKQPPERREGFVAAHDPATGLVLAYVFRSDVFPWLTLWEENRCRQASPWNGDVQARGLEFGTTPFPLGNEAVDAQVSVLGMRSSRPLAAGGTVTAPWAMIAARLPRSCARIDDIRVEQDAVTVRCGTERTPLPAAGIASFLFAEGGGR